MPQVSVSCEHPWFTVVQENPNFGVVKSIPSGIVPQLEAAVRDFITSSHTPEGIDLNGYYHQTLQALANASVLGGPGDLWIGTLDGQLCIYLLAHINNDIDGKLSYHVSQGWVRKDQRGKPWVKWAWEQVRKRAKDCLCGHFSVSSTRENDAAYCRFLGKGFRKYATILMEDF